MRKPYPSDLTDEQWAIVEPLIPVYEVGRPREVSMREVLNSISYLNRSGCQWDMLPHDLLPKSTVYDHFARWKADGDWQVILDALRRQVRAAGGHDPSPSVASIWADGKYNNRSLDRWLAGERVGYAIDVVGRPAGSEGFVEQPRRYTVERTFAWPGRYRRQSRDYERLAESSEAMIEVSSIHRMLRILKKDTMKKAIPFKYREIPEKITG
jgi:transposase